MESLAGILIAHLSHGLSVLMLYYLTNSVFAGSVSSVRDGKKLAFITACLHIFSPTGLFLSAPYTESTFAFLSFSGYYLFIHSIGDSESSSIKKDVNLILAGTFFGLSVTIRSNGILNGILFLEEAIRALLSFKIRRLLAAGLGGALVGVGFALPQFIAYQQFCADMGQVGTEREWCVSVVPSIYRFVQSHYWFVSSFLVNPFATRHPRLMPKPRNSGFLRYWTLSNIPLFLLAAPMFTILALSSAWGVGVKNFQSGSSKTGTKKQVQSTRNNSSIYTVRMVRIMAAIQGILGVTTLVNAHVQIITRMASGYPIW